MSGMGMHVSTDKFSSRHLKFNLDRIELHWDFEGRLRHDEEVGGGHLKLLRGDLVLELDRCQDG